MIILSKEQVLMMHRQLITATGGSDGIRDEGMLDSALLNPFQSFGGEELYPSIQAKAAQIRALFQDCENRRWENYIW